MSDGDSTSDARHNKRQRISEDEYKEIHTRIESHTDVLQGRKVWKNLPEYFMPQLLGIIANSSEGRISIPESIFFKEYWPELRDKLCKAWDETCYREVVTSDYIQATSCLLPQSDSNESMDSATKEHIQEPLGRAWKEPFRGNYHEVLFRNINAMYVKGSPYENMCAVIQSSGTGKSRMVDELAKTVFTLPINIRNDQQSVTAYPPADNSLYEHLVEGAIGRSYDECRKHYIRFFKCLFVHAAKRLDVLKSHSDDDSIIRGWYDHLDVVTNRNKFYEEVVSSCKNPQQQHGHDTGDSDLSMLIAKLSLRSSEKPIKVVLYIDEAHELKKRCRQGSSTQLDALCSVVSRLCACELFCILLSTQSSLPLLAPPSEFVASARARVSKLLQPITEIPFDCAPDILVKQGVLYVEDLAKVTYATKWGRPLWWSMRPLDDDENSIQGFIKFVRAKLLCQNDVDGNYHSVQIPALAAILDVLLTLNYEPRRALVKDFQADMVQSHMRIVYSVPGHRKYFSSGYSSEPILAEAAAQQLWEFQKHSQADDVNDIRLMVNIFNKTGLIENSFVDLGQRGEIVMRMFLIRAYMDAVVTDLGGPDQASKLGIIFSRGCTLITFIRELFQQPHAQQILGAAPDNIADVTTFSEAFEHAMVRFTHFARAADDCEMSSEAMFAAFARGVAFIGHITQEDVDIIIPILLNKGSTLREPAMSAMLIQVKRRTRRSPPQKFAFFEEDVGLFPENEDEEAQKRPYIVLIAQLGVKSENGRTARQSVNFLKQQEYDPPDTHPRYTIVGYGGSGVYKHVDEDNLSFLLSNRKFLVEHRQDLESRDLVMRMLPHWEYGESTYHWAEVGERLKPQK